MEQISRWAHESMIARMERIIHRLIFVIILLVILLVGTNACWLWYESQFETMTVEQEVENGDGNTIVNGVGDLRIGEGETESDDKTP